MLVKEKFIFFGLIGAVHFNVALGIELKTAFQSKAPPRYFIEDDNAKGICVDIIADLNKRLEKNNIKIVSINIDMPISRLKEYLKSGALDVFLCLSKNKDREKIYQYSTPLYKMQYTFAKLTTNSFEFNGENSLKGFAFGVLQGTNSAKRLGMVKGVTIFALHSIDQGYKMLLHKRIEAMFYHNLGLGWNIKKNNEFKGKIILVDNPFITKEQYMVFSQKVSKEVITKVEKALSTMYIDGAVSVIMENYGVAKY
ncbi:transporter substrate-binding domain-containing protein [Endozoicomonas sp. SM1973]|uniref:Transporter substrate-binding domain-containing protein n=1 Tax=Spartinivicinus marinus TaxID=2994442 RepID=A0A853I8T2_9GAMM|nr:transporter substrate-binding domain-containing protein [Spartinivicinus marinus]MCX4027699.1 transporter substrate-binding domain-containing protein [Spartinivicinus marinus]NYZ69259.1 transporter substrate-binding domain-containing protein [Spartinivicinus marinus]